MVDLTKCESPIEEKMLIAMTEAFDRSVAVVCQHPVTTPAGNYRADFWVEAAGLVRVIEVDGRDFHDFTTDLRRDIAMLALGGVDEVFRFRGCDVHHSPDHCLMVIRAFAPELFDPAQQRPSSKDKVSIARMLYGGEFGPKPIVRCRMPSQPGLAHLVDEHQTGSLLVRGADAIIAQFKSPYWRKQKETEPSEQLMDL